MKPRVYLAGPISNCDIGQATDWRKYAAERLAESNIKGISPLRCEQPAGARYSHRGNENDPVFGTARAISSKNKTDVLMCAMTLVYLPASIVSVKPSLGSVIELAWASAFNKPTVLVTDDDYTAEHAVINACAGWVVRDLDSGLAIVIGTLHDYAN